MEGRDYRRFAKISIQARKKSTKNTVRGICFGLILLIPVIFFAMAFYFGLTGEINQTKTIACFSLSSRNVRDSGPLLTKPLVATGDYSYYDGLGINDYQSIAELSRDEKVKEKLVSEYYSLKCQSLSDNIIGGKSSFLKAQINGVEKSLKDITNNSNSNNNRNIEYSIRAAHLNLSDNKLFTKAEEQDFKKIYGDEEIIKKGEGFTLGNSKKQVMVSEAFYQKNGFNSFEKGDILTLTIGGTGDNYYLGASSKINAGQSSSGETPVFDILTDFEIVGIINNNYYKLPSTSQEAHIWITSDSLYLNSDYETVAPPMTLVEEENNRKYIEFDYSQGEAMQAKAANNGVMYIAFGAIDTFCPGGIGFYNYNPVAQNLLKIAPIVTKIQFENYNDASSFSNKIFSLYKLFDPSLDAMYATSNYSNALFESFSMINMVGNYLILILFVFGGIIFFATMLNLYNTVNYSVQVRKNYMGVMRAIGAKQKVIPKMYFYEIVLIFLRALPWVLVISGLLSLGIKLGVDFLFKLGAEMLGITLKINFLFFLAALAIMVAVVFLIAFMFSQIACKNAARKPILTVLSDDKG